MREVALRATEPADVPLFHRHQQDPVAVRMAAFTSVELADARVFAERWRRILADPTTTVRTITVDGEPVGHVLKYVDDGHPEVSYWLGREHWGQGLATEALRLFLAELPERPVHARVAQDNAGSLAVLRRNGFTITGEDVQFAAGRGDVVREYALILTVNPPGHSQPAKPL